MDSQAPRTVFLNGRFLPEMDAKVSIFDRGFLMADAIYEYTAVINGKLLEFDAHMDRLQRSLNELDFEYTVDRHDMLSLHRRLK